MPDLLKNIEYVLPTEIEKRSFEIIQEELSQKGIVLPEKEDKITRRVIHTSADFEYADTLKYSENAVDIVKNLVKNHATIVTDTNMGLAGINKKVLKTLDIEAKCFMADEKIAKLAKENNVTRATMSMKFASELDGPVIFAIGNAPTALIELYKLMQEGYKPAFIIGVPVGFVNVEASKELILNSDVPYIVNKGRKGGSNVAAAICNAILYQVRDELNLKN
ncbi:precorrin-8X methylmutase [Lachnobacterium bovis]|uniref:Precorrin-8X methylmutase n=1 Tax=Lachnobacterium bovis TaxID=140626 RepID=A0A1H9Q9Q0_9FIRM|nr:precorrin-8X methylmutase [Lachnobacterium bovis]SER57157.1 precorrin-8X methylmutase [Lachnobacterium bovis]